MTGRRLAERSAFRLRLVAMRYSQVRIEGPFREVADTLPGGQHRLLEHVLGVGRRAEDPVAVDLQLPSVPVHQLPECVAVALPGPAHQLCGHHLILPSSRLLPSRQY
jgi:hypothetical protein